MSTSERKEWRRSFTETIMSLAGGTVDVLEAASWAMEAQHEQGHRDPREAAYEQFKNVATPLPENRCRPDHMPASPALPANRNSLAPQPAENRIDAGNP
jgi:hypothetical protein